VRILFIHQNFPGQFVHLAPALAARGHHVVVLTSSENQHKTFIPTLRYKFEDKRESFRSYGLAADLADKTHRAEAVARAAQIMRSRDGFVPDVVFGHLGWGETLYLKELWPEARHLAYAEFFYQPRGLDVGFDPELQQRTLQGDIWVRTRQAPLLLAMSVADRALAPTRWQAASFPAHLRERISVIHDGVDTDAVAPRAVAALTLPGTDRPIGVGDEILTFVSRNLEPYRGYHIFMRALPAILAARPKARAVIVGGDDVSYGTRAPVGQSWKQIFLDEVKERLDPARVHFVGKLPYGTYLDLMRVTRAHAYLTYPFVLSWSMLEAMSAGALVVGSRTPPVEEVIQDGVNGRLVDFFDVDAWSSALIDVLAAPERFEPLRAAARRTVVETYDLKTRCLPQLIDFVENPV
jgi:glycosyltransferase involved in cell wall biosynthesis